MNESTTTRAPRCTGCLHWKTLWYIGGTREEPTRACLYILDTGHRRGSSVESCTKKTSLLDLADFLPDERLAELVRESMYRLDSWT